eukprot:2396534-Pyramimonas_sp.AAC.1
MQSTVCSTQFTQAIASMNKSRVGTPKPMALNAAKAFRAKKALRSRPVGAGRVAVQTVMSSKPMLLSDAPLKDLDPEVCGASPRVAPSSDRVNLCDHRDEEAAGVTEKTWPAVQFARTDDRSYDTLILDY